MRTLHKKGEYRGVAYEVYVSCGQEEVTVEVQDPFGDNKAIEHHDYVEDGQRKMIPEDIRDEFIESVCASAEGQFRETVDDWLSHDTSPSL
nr:hypothetical protein [Halomonas elongata]